MTQYRVVTKINKHGVEYYEIEFLHFALGPLTWWVEAQYSRYLNQTEWKDYTALTQERAVEIIYRLVEEDQRKADAANKVKNFKSKVVYGPYPP